MPERSHCITKKRLVLSIIVNTSARTIEFGGKSYPCRIGRKGVVAAAQGREGDEKTPLGTYHLRFGLYRAYRLPRPPTTAKKGPLAFRPLRQDDGWCDAPNNAAYNRHVRLPYPASAERLWRGDGAYDIILVMSHNDSPPEQGKGSAVFIHVAQADDRETLGCVTVTPEVMVRLLPELRPGMAVKVVWSISNTISACTAKQTWK